MASITALKALEATVRLGGIRQAAEELHVTPGAISQQIRGLERHFDRDLFDRHARSMVPSAAARELCRNLEKAFSLIDEAIDVFEREDRTPPLRISTLPSIASRFVLPNLPRIRKATGGAQLSFTYVHRIADFTLDDVDLLLCVRDGAAAFDDGCYRLLQGYAQPVCSPDYLGERSVPIDPGEIARAELLHDWDTKDWNDWFENCGHTLQEPISGDVFEDFGLLGAAAAAGHGFALCPTALIDREIASGELKVVHDQAIHEDRWYCAVTRMPEAEAVSRFVEWLQETVEKS